MAMKNIKYVMASQLNQKSVKLYTKLNCILVRFSTSDMTNYNNTEKSDEIYMVNKYISRLYLQYTFCSYEGCVVFWPHAI